MVIKHKKDPSDNIYVHSIRGIVTMVFDLRFRRIEFIANGVLLQTMQIIK